MGDDDRRRPGPSVVLRGELRLVDFDPVRGSEARKRRPAVIVSNDGANAMAARLGRGVITVVPVTSNVARVYPFQVFLTSAATGLGVSDRSLAMRLSSTSSTAPRPMLKMVTPGSVR